MVSHYNVISNDRLPSKTKIGKDSWKRFRKKSRLCKPEFSSATKTSFLIKKTKNNHTSTSDSWEYIKNRFTENAKVLSKNSTKQENLQFQETICFFIKNINKNLFCKCLVGKHQV